MTNHIELSEVICHKPDSNGHAYGITFATEQEAKAYARQMQAAGYKAERSPVFCPAESVETALAEAAGYFKDKAILKAEAAPIKYLIERSNDQGRTVTYKSAKGWTNDEDKATRYDTDQEAMEIAADLNSHAATKGTAYLHNVTEA